MPDHYDVLTIAAVVDELAATIGDGRIQRIGLVDARTIGAEVYANGRRHYLLASADDRLPRLRLAAEMPSLDPSLVTPFGLLLRKYARGGVILGIDQPPLERMVRVSIAKRLPALTNRDDAAAGESDPAEDEDASEFATGDIAYTSLYIELMGRHSNLILVDDEGLILESAKRVTPVMSRVRAVLPRTIYLPPPPPERRDPRELTPAEAVRWLGALAADADLARALVSSFRGISPLMAREVVFRATGSSNLSAGAVDAIAAEGIAAHLEELLAPLEGRAWQPRVYLDRGGEHEGEAVAVSPIPYRHLGADHDEIAVGSISQAAAMVEDAAGRASPQRHAQRRQRLLDAVAAAREKADRKRNAIAEQAARAADADHLRRAGELIYAYLWHIGPGQKVLEVEGDTIALDPALSAKENAQDYFERYRKAQSADQQLPQLVEEVEAEIAYLDQLATLVAQAPGFTELEALAAEWAEHGGSQSETRSRRKAAPRRPKPLLDAEGNSIFIGRSGTQNDLVTFDIAGPDDTWLHARGVPGSHVVIRWRTPGPEEDETTIAAAAALAAWYSAARESGAVEVDVARRRHVRKIKGGRPGMVTYRNERTIRVRPAPEERLRDVLSVG